MTPNPDFKVTPLFDVEYLGNDMASHGLSATAEFLVIVTV